MVEATELLARRELSARELTDACLGRIAERDGVHSRDGDPGSVNAWVRVYEEEARAAAAAADERLTRRDAPRLCGVPIGLKDLYGVAGKPVTASSRVLDDVPARDCDAWARLEAEGMVLLGHLHTHEFAAGGGNDQVGNPWNLALSPGGSSGGSAAALASRQTPAATGTDTAGSLRIPSTDCGTSTIKPTRGAVSIRGIVPLAATFDHAGPMARTVADCEPLLAAMSGGRAPETRRELRRVAVSPRVRDLDPDVAEGFERAIAQLPLADVPAPDVRLDIGLLFFDLVTTEMLAWHRRFDDRRALYRPSVRSFLEHAENRAMGAQEYANAQQQRIEDAWSWQDWFVENRVDAIVEPTLPVIAHARGHGYDPGFADEEVISLTHLWDWTGFPVVALPSGVGSRSGVPTGVSLIGPPGADFELLAWGAALQNELGAVSP